MFFLQAAMAPLELEYKGKLYTVPRFTIGDFINWGSEIAQQNTEVVTAEMDDEQRRNYLTFYPPVPPDFNELKRRVRAPEGVKKVIETCLPKANPPFSSENVAEILSSNSNGTLEHLAWELADLKDTSMADPKKIAKPEAGQDPLARSPKPDSKLSSSTGDGPSPSSQQPTPGRMPEPGRPVSSSIG